MTTTLSPPDLRRYQSSTQLTMRGATETQGLPAGVCGQVEGVAMVYDVVDSHGTTFARGCLERTCRERVAAGKVRLFLDHGDAPSSGMYDTHLHIGVVRAVFDVQEPDGTWVARFRADIYDTEPGRKEHEYLKAVAATNSETGVSVGLLKMPETVRCVVGGVEAFRISEVALGEISITSMPSVPGTRVTAVRADTSAPIDYYALLDGLVAHLGAAAVRARLGAPVSDAVVEDSNTESGAPASAVSDASDADSQGDAQGGTEPSVPNVGVEERLAFVRAHLPRLYRE